MYVIKNNHFSLFCNYFDRFKALKCQEQLLTAFLLFSNWQLKSNPHALHVVGLDILQQSSQLISKKSVSINLVQVVHAICCDQVSLKSLKA